MRPLPWREAMTHALYDPTEGFFTSGSGSPADHFRTSVHASPLFASALLRLLVDVDAALGRPDVVDVVDIGAGRGELLRRMAAIAPADLAGRLRLTAVEVAARPADLPDRIAWRAEPPERITGLLLATEWLDNVPLDVVVRDDEGHIRTVLVDRTGTESLGGTVGAPAGRWLADWWPLAEAPPGARAEIGDARDTAWSDAVSTLDAGLALAVDYAHVAAHRPVSGSMAGYRAGHRVPPVPDGSCDITAHVAIDAAEAAARRVTGVPGTVLAQRAALRALGVSGTRPPLALASTDPAGYVRALAAASQAAELTDPDGLGGHCWLLSPTRELAGVAAALAGRAGVTAGAQGGSVG